MPNIEFKITAVVSASPGDFPTTSECLEALGKRADEIVRPYGGRLINVDSKTHEFTDGVGAKARKLIVTDRVILVMDASGVLQS